MVWYPQRTSCYALFVLDVDVDVDVACVSWQSKSISRLDAWQDHVVRTMMFLSRVFMDLIVNVV